MRWMPPRQRRGQEERDRYRESVRASWPVAAAMLALLTASGWAALDRSFGTAAADGGILPALPYWSLTVALVLILHWFLDLEIAVGDRALSLRFGPVARDLDAQQVVDVAVEPYDWRPYARHEAGRGARRRRAFTAPFVRSGVVVTTSDGTRYDVASRRPEALREAVEQLIEEHGGVE